MRTHCHPHGEKKSYLKSFLEKIKQAELKCKYSPILCLLYLIELPLPVLLIQFIHPTESCINQNFPWLILMKCAHYIWMDLWLQAQENFGLKRTAQYL